MTAKYGRIVPLVLGLLTLTPSVRAQNTFNPYGNSGLPDYREFASPTRSNNPSLPGQARIQNEPTISRPRANTYEQYVNDLDSPSPGIGSTSARGASSGLPYYQTFRQYDQQLNRVYRPNDSKANREFEKRVQQRNASYGEALAERDPAKRARLMNQVERDPLRARAAAPKARATTGAAAAPSSTGRSPAPSSSRAPDPFAIAPERRSQPPAATDVAPRRPATSSAPARRPPASSDPASAATIRPTAPSVGPATPSMPPSSTTTPGPISPIPSPSRIPPPI